MLSQTFPCFHILVLCSPPPSSIPPFLPLSPSKVLTQADGSQQAQAVLRGEAGGEEGLQHVVGEGKGDNGLVSGVDDQHSDPQSQESEQSITSQISVM